MSISLRNATILGTAVAGTSTNAPSSSELAKLFSNPPSTDSLSTTQIADAELATNRLATAMKQTLAGNGADAISGGRDERTTQSQSLPSTGSGISIA